MPKYSYHYLLAASALFFSACTPSAARVLPERNTETDTKIIQNEQEYLDQAVLKQSTASLEYSLKETE